MIPNPKFQNDPLPLLSVKWIRICILRLKWNSSPEGPFRHFFLEFELHSRSKVTIWRPVSADLWVFYIEENCGRSPGTLQAGSVAVPPFLNPGVISVHHVMRNDGDCSQTAQLHCRTLGNQGNLFGSFLPSFLSSLILIITKNQPSYAMLSFL